MVEGTRFNREQWATQLSPIVQLWQKGRLYIIYWGIYFPKNHFEDYANTLLVIYGKRYPQSRAVEQAF